MYWRVIPGVVAVAVNTNEAPSDKDWDAYLADVAAQIHTIKGVLAYSESVGPSASQRARVDEAYKSTQVELKTAIMSGSRVVRGVVTALNWALGGKVRAFSTQDFTGAADYLQLDDEEQLKTRVVLKQLARSAGVVVEAFADESGQFNKKYR
jgi:hypothetical protein